MLFITLSVMKRTLMPRARLTFFQWLLSLLFLLCGVAYSGVVNCHKPLLEHLFDGVDVLESDGAHCQFPFVQLAADNVVHKLADVLFGIFFKAVRSENLSLVEYLLENGGEPYWTPFNEKTILDYARKQNNEALLELLFNYLN